MSTEIGRKELLNDMPGSYKHLDKKLDLDIFMTHDRVCPEAQNHAHAQSSTTDGMILLQGQPDVNSYVRVVSWLRYEMPLR